MDDLDLRLRAADPAAGRPYRTPDGLVARVVARERRPRRVVPAFAWRVLAAAGASVAVTVGAVTALTEVAPGFAALEVAAAVPPPPSAGPAPFATMEAVALAPTVSPALRLVSGAHAPRQIQVTTLAAPGRLKGEALRLGRALGLTGPARRTGTAPVSWRVGTPPGATLEVVGGAVPQWYYSSSSPAIAPATQSAGPLESAAERAALRARADRLLARLGFRLSLGTATYVDAVMDGATPSDVYREITATFVVTHDGLATDQRVVVSVDGRNRLLYAAGPDVAPSRDVPYALESPRAALAALARGPGGPAAPAMAAAVPASALVVRTHLSLRAFEVRGGATWWLPVYTFTDRAGARWQVLALTAGEGRILRGAAGLDAHVVVAP